MLTKAKWIGAGALAMVAAISPANAGPVVVLDFEGVNANYPSGFAFVNNFYNGGTSSDGTSGTNYGVSFSSNAQAICLNTIGTSCSNTSRGGLAPGSDKGGLFFLSGSETFMNYSGGFDTGFSFFYSSASVPGSVNVYDGINGTGNILATIALSPNSGSCVGYNAGFCPFSAVGVSFGGTALSIGFAGVANQIVFDDITFGSVTPGTPGVPEPASWAMMIGGFGLAGAALRGSRKRKLAVA